jgi:hypothetical protein
MRLVALQTSHRLTSRIRQRRRCFSSFESSTLFKFADQNEESSDNHESTQPQNDESPPTKKLIFPWRHEEDPLPRLVPGTLDYDTKSHLLSTTSMTPGNSTMNALATAFMFLDVPFYQFFFFGSWKGDLADSMSWAFTQGTAGLLSNLSLGELLFFAFCCCWTQLSYGTSIVVAIGCKTHMYISLF